MPTKTDTRKQFLIDVFTTALEGGIGYWSLCYQYHWTLEPEGDSLGNPDLDGFYAVIEETEEPFIEGEPGHRITQDTIVKGLSRIDAGTPDTLHLHASYIGRIIGASRANDAGMLDAADADIVVQVGLFGEVVYG